MRFLSIDQSFSNTAVVLWEDGEALTSFVVRTGLISPDKPEKNGVLYFPSRWSAAKWIATHIALLGENHCVGDYAIESPAFSSLGNMTRDLGGLFFMIKGALSNLTDYDVTPTQVKKEAW